MAFHRRLFAVKASVRALMASVRTVQALMVSGPTAPLGEREKAVAVLEALASALVDLSEAGLERLQAAKR